MERISMSENTISLYVYKGGQGEITEKKSRFIATVRPVESEDEAVRFINEIGRASCRERV